MNSQKIPKGPRIFLFIPSSSPGLRSLCFLEHFIYHAPFPRAIDFLPFKSYEFLRDLYEKYNVLHRVGLKEEEEIEELLSLFAKGFNILFSTKTPKIRAVKNDPADDKFIECAVGLKGEVIITGDRAVKALGEYMGIKILSPQQFLEAVRIS
jgi:hypothetical protein